MTPIQFFKNISSGNIIHRTDSFLYVRHVRKMFIERLKDRYINKSIFGSDQFSKTICLQNNDAYSH